MIQSIKIIATNAFILVFSFGYCQIESYDLSKFVQADYTIRTLALSPDFFFDSRNDKVNVINDTQGGGSLIMSYTNFKNDGNKYSSYSSNNSLGARGDRENNNRSIILNSFLSSDYLINKYYTNNRFISLEIDNEVSLSRRKNYISGQKTRNVFGNNKLNIAIGKGRIQSISDPLKALAILKLLKADNYLLREVTHNDIDELSNKLTQLRGLRNNNTQFTDSRLLRNENFEQLGKCLVEMGLVENDGFGMAALLYDAWRFESFFNRFTNNEFRIGIESTQAYQESMSDFTNSWLNHFNGFFASFKINRPIDTEWYYYAHNKVAYGYLYDKYFFREEITYSKGPRLLIESNWAVGYQPSARISSEWGLNLKYRKYSLNPDALAYWTDKLIEFNVYGDMNYYISPQYRVSGNLGVTNDNYSNVDFAKSHTVQIYFNLGVDYYFF